MTETKKNPIGRFIENTLVPISTAFAQNRYVRCIGTGSQNLMAIIMIGAVFNLLNSIQIDPYQSFIQATGIAAFLNAVYNACMNFMGVFMVFSVGYAGAKIFGHDEMAFNNGLMSLMSYLIMVPVATNEVGSTVVVLDYLGSHGVFLAFILGIMATKINIALVERNITIKMPAGVPENVTQCFTSIIPGAAIALVSSLLRGLFTLTPWGNVIDAVYALLQTPLANITGSLGGFIILLLLAQILWFFGVHGSYTVLAILYPLWFTYLPENTAAAAAGLPIPHMWNTSMYDFACNGGCGCTLGLVIVMFLFAKSKRYKEFSKIVLPCGIFNINEPLPPSRCRSSAFPPTNQAHPPRFLHQRGLLPPGSVCLTLFLCPSLPNRSDLRQHPCLALRPPALSPRLNRPPYPSRCRSNRWYLLLR